MNHKALAAAEKSARAAKRVRRPLFQIGCCWALIRNHTGSVASRVLGQYVQCSKQARKGCLTCRWHQDRELDAKQLKDQPPKGTFG